MGIQEPTRRQVLKFGGGAVVLGVGVGGCANTLRNIADAIDLQTAGKDSPEIRLDQAVMDYDRRNAEERRTVRQAVRSIYAQNLDNFVFAVSAKVTGAEGGYIGTEREIPLHWRQMAYLVDGGKFGELVVKGTYEAPRGASQDEIFQLGSLVIPADTITGENLVRLAQRRGNNFRSTKTSAEAQRVWVNTGSHVVMYALQLREFADAIPDLRVLDTRFKGPRPYDGLRAAQLDDRVGMEITRQGMPGGFQLYSVKKA